MKQWYVYIMTNQSNNVLYTGITNNIELRAWRHKVGTGSSFTQKYRCKKLVYLEPHTEVGEATQREKRIKRWKRSWKIELIEARNPEWRDVLYSK